MLPTLSVAHVVSLPPINMVVPVAFICSTFETNFQRVLEMNVEDMRIGRSGIETQENTEEVTVSRSSRLKQDVEEVGGGKSDGCDESSRGEAVSCHGDAVLLGRSRSNCENDSESRPKAEARSREVLVYAVLRYREQEAFSY